MTKQENGEKRRANVVREKVCKSIKRSIVSSDSLSRYHEVVEESELAVQIPSLELRVVDIIGHITLQQNFPPPVFLSD
jgi:hypothetical protein